MSIGYLASLLRHPRTLIDSILTYPRFLGVIKPALLSGVSNELPVRLQCFHAGWWPTMLKVPLGRRILALSAHPDDETIGAGGLLIAHKGLADISVITIFNGDGGGRLLDLEEGAAGYKRLLVERRRCELEAACAYFGGRIAGRLDISDGTTPDPLSPLAQRLRLLVDEVRPDIVLLPWFLDRHADHRLTNLLWAMSCKDLPCMVLGTEIWSMVSPNALLDITPYLPAKLAAIAEFKTQLATVNYLSFAEGLAKTRAFYASIGPNRGGAAEAFLALPNHEYCDLVMQVRRALGPLPAREKA